MAESVEELLEIFNKGLVPPASDKLRKVFYDLNKGAHDFAEMLGAIRDGLQGHGVGDPEQIYTLSYVKDKLDNLWGYAQNNLDLEKPYNFDDLQAFKTFLGSELNDMLYQLRSVDWITDNIQNRFIGLDSVFDDFVKDVGAEDVLNNDKRLSLQNAADRDVALDHEEIAPQIQEDVIIEQQDDDEKIIENIQPEKPQEYEMPVQDQQTIADVEPEPEIHQPDKVPDEHVFEKPEQPRAEPQIEILQPQQEEQRDMVADAEKREAQEKALKDIRNFIMAYDNMFSGNQMSEATYELDKMSKYISQAMADGSIAKSDASRYKRMIQNIYMNKDWRQVSDNVEKMLDMNDRQMERITKEMDAPRTMSDDKEQQVNKADIFHEATQRVLDKQEQEKEEKRKEKLLINKMFGKVNL